MRDLVFVAALATAVLPARAFAQAQPSPDHAQQALVQMVQEAQGREAQALVQVYSLRARVNDLQGQLAEQTKRANEADAKAKLEPSAETR